MQKKIRLRQLAIKLMICRTVFETIILYFLEFPKISGIKRLIHNVIDCKVLIPVKNKDQSAFLFLLIICMNSIHFEKVLNA